LWKPRNEAMMAPVLKNKKKADLCHLLI
jgi:hypothetical protein